MDVNIFDKNLISTEVEPETFFNLFNNNTEVTETLRHQFNNLSDMDKIEVYKLAQNNNKMDLYNALVNKEKGRGFEIVSRFKDILLPKRSTEHSAGYDFFAPQDFIIPSSLTSIHKNGRPYSGLSKPFMIGTGVKAYMEEDEVLFLYNRSSNSGIKSLILANGVGVVDSDYYNNPDNEGEIGFMFFNISAEDVEIKKGDKIGQGIFQKFLKADNDVRGGERISGFGSTGV